MPVQTITTTGFLSEFIRRHELLPDRPFCWVLGSGASVQSGIPTGTVLVIEWLKELHEMEDLGQSPFEEWATEKNLGIKNFDFKSAAAFYPWIYWRRFRRFREEGYAFLEKAMEHKEPSYGYSVLAQIMAGTQHKAAITTNFDNLIADALAIYTRALPLVCGHESLTGFIRPNLKRPLIAKIHRDLLLNPMNEPSEIEKLSVEWTVALTTIFTNYTPIVVGYGGNDGSLMGFLKTLKPITGGIFWCYRIGDKLDQRVKAIIERHDGNLVPILGFDELMLQLWTKLKLPSPIPELQATHDKRKVEFQKQFKELNTSLEKPGKTPVAEKELKKVRAAAATAVERLTKEEEDRWAWQLKAQAALNPEEAEAIYREGLKDFPDSDELTGDFANFMWDVRKDYDEAERLYRKALEVNPNHAHHTSCFAMFMETVRKDYDEAERLYRKALELDPNCAIRARDYAEFMETVRKDHDEAERLYRKALELDPKDANLTSSFATFMELIRRDYDEAERLYRKALELDPNARHTGNFAHFMWNVRKDYDEAERLYRKALELDPNHATNTGEFASFMELIRKDYDEAERLYRKALELDPNARHTGNFAHFMWNARKDHDEAERLYRKALELDPKDADHTGYFASFMEIVRKDYGEAARLYRKALELEPENSSIKTHYADFIRRHPEFEPVTPTL